MINVGRKTFSMLKNYDYYNRKYKEYEFLLLINYLREIRKVSNITLLCIAQRYCFSHSHFVILFHKNFRTYLLHVRVKAFFTLTNK